jgi:hypothetical protein
MTGGLAQPKPSPDTNSVLIGYISMLERILGKDEA